MKIKSYILCCAMLCVLTVRAQIKGIPASLLTLDEQSYEQAKPWVVWYFMHASYSKEGITADLQAMAANNIAGAYFTPIKAKTNPPLFEPASETLTPEWWEMFRHIVSEAKKYNIKIAMFPNDGFATAGGPWITPEKSMQKIVAADTVVSSNGKKKLRVQLPQPERNEGYYEDIQLYAIAQPQTYKNSFTHPPKVSSSYDEDLQRLVSKGNDKHFATSQPGWIQYEFKEPFAANALKIEWKASNYQANRLKILISDDGKSFRPLVQLQAPRMGWLDWDNGVTHTLPHTKAKFYRFVYDPKGSEPGAEDLDVAKWKPSLKLLGITLSEEAKINQIESKTAEIWRVSLPTAGTEIPDKNIIHQQDIRVLNSPSKSGMIDLDLPKGSWKILRIGHTSTGHKNETAGAAKGLECDKLDADVVAFQFEQWYGKAKKAVEPNLSKEVLTVFHIDSWESGSQNWTRRMAEEFKKRRGYSLDKYMPVLAGYVLHSAEASESFLHDYRETIAELLLEKGFKTLKQMCDKYEVEFTAETTAPVMASDGLSHFSLTDRTMGEFWFRSPSHDKPNDVLDAVSGAHIYGKNVVMSEAFTQIRMEWDEHPRLLKPVQDLNYALGVNNLAYHVYVHNPWMDRKPGMTLDGIGTYFQRDQIWWKPGKAWVDYAIRTQQLLQQGKPVKDVAVFIGEEVPRRAILPDRLVGVLPGIIGADRVSRTAEKLANEGQPLQKIASVSTSANMYSTMDWIDPLRGYAYDSFNPHALLAYAKVRDGAVQFADHIAYKILVVPGKHLLNPNPEASSLAVLSKFASLIDEGATILFETKPTKSIGHLSSSDSSAFQALLNQLFNGMTNENGMLTKTIGKGKIHLGAYKAADFNPLGIAEDLIIDDKKTTSIAWNHRRFAGTDSYFLSNQDSVSRKAVLSFRTNASHVYLYDAVNDELNAIPAQRKGQRTEATVDFAPHQALFVLLSEADVRLPNWKIQRTETVKGDWTLQLEGQEDNKINQKTPAFWTESTTDEVRYHAGKGTYALHFKQTGSSKGQRVALQLDDVEGMAEVVLNGKPVGVIWAKPYEIDVTDFLQNGSNRLEISVYHTWGNRFGYEASGKAKEKIMQTTATPKFLKPLQPAGLSGNVALLWYKEIQEHNNKNLKARDKR
ncbi:glycosyl hydrolase [Sphingobacterium deserti]|uniref:Glycoside hydrolase family 2 sugar binding protein n=1 Tax=Sphingobacterium deserti TaxID=1229276 RepID=A0A0B8T8G0_9SPHI|nr:glycosyl hydrolase [Sphingobacterium deserti]KGE14939.1 glycoside hydrolase family 2 sugar binding protein [Sphingobacterium deserti]